MRSSARWCAAAAAVLAAGGAWGQTPPAEEAQGPAMRPPPELPASWAPQPGGLTADLAAQRAVRTSLGVRAARANVDAASAGRTEAAVAMIPQLSLTARYSRLSPITQPSFNLAAALPLCVDTGNGSVLATAPGTPCPGSSRSFASLASGGQSSSPFPVILNNYAFNATVALPITDIPFRLARIYEGAGLTEEARRLDEVSARNTAAADARVAFYEMVRATGQLLAAQEALEAARQHEQDLARFVEAGTVARVDLLRVQAQVAESERLVLAAREGHGLAETQLRQRMHAGAEERFVMGESLETPPAVPSNVAVLVSRALSARPELQSLDRQAGALRATASATRVGMFPSVVGQFSVDLQNPNQRYVPQAEEFNTTWTATLQAQWSLGGALQASAQVSRLNAQRLALLAQLDQLREGTEIEVRSVWISAQTATAAIESARRQVESAEESYRVRRERFRAGSAVSSDLTDAELDLLRARLALINANVDQREALARLRRAVGEREPD